MNVSDTLNKAADLIQERGWRKGGGGWPFKPEREHTSLCLEGGIMAALGVYVMDDDFGFYESLWSCPAYRAVADYLDRDVTYDPEATTLAEPLYRWNDQTADTAEQVIEVLRAAALVEAAREAELAAVTS